MTTLALSPFGIADQSSAPSHVGRRLAFLIKNLNGGGVQRMTMAVARHYAERGHEVDLLVLEPEGVLESQVPAAIELKPLRFSKLPLRRLGPLAADPAGLREMLRPVLLAPRPDWTIGFLSSLAAYLRRERPDALLTATPRLNILAVWARRMAGTRTRVLVSERTAPSQDGIGTSKSIRKRHMPALMRRTYSQADAVVAVSEGVALDLARVTGLPRSRIRRVYNPVVGPDLARLAAAPVTHPWFGDGGPPVVLSVGRLTDQKDFPTLVRAFARLRAERPVRLVILGAAQRDELDRERRGELVELTRTLGVADDVDLPGFAGNPYAYMAKSDLFVLASAWEGFGNVLVEAMACGCPVASTDCPSGPAEILEGGRYGPLVPVGDAEALARAMARVLDRPLSAALLKERAAAFTVDRTANAYLGALFGHA